MDSNGMSSCISLDVPNPHVIAGCAGGLYDSIIEAASILKGHTGGCGEYSLSVYPASQPVRMLWTRPGPGPA